MGKPFFIRFPLLIRFFFPHFLYSIKNDSKKIFLTFDDGPIPEVTPLILGILSKFNAKASFFCLGKNVEHHPEIFNSIKEHGHTIGNHGYEHKNGWKTPNIKYFENTEKANELIKSNLFRPPYGKISPIQIIKLSKKYKIVLWDILSGDFDPNISKEKCAENVIKKIKPGSIIVFHDSLKAKERVLYALPIVLDVLQKKGFEFSGL
jgi:peptidoglycan/xylan/chitin deacetylase (PgdA/CDA1 family)